MMNYAPYDVSDYDGLGIACLNPLGRAMESGPARRGDVPLAAARLIPTVERNGLLAIYLAASTGTLLKSMDWAGGHLGEIDIWSRAVQGNHNLWYLYREMSDWSTFHSRYISFQEAGVKHPFIGVALCDVHDTTPDAFLHRLDKLSLGTMLRITRYGGNLELMDSVADENIDLEMVGSLLGVA